MIDKSVVENKPRKDGWDKAQVIGSLLLPVALAFVGFALSGRISRREQQAEYVRLATEIVRNDPTSSSKPGLRLYAYNVLKDLSPYPLPPALEAEMLGTPLATDSTRKPDSWTSARGGRAGFRSGPASAYVYIDGVVRATTPAALELSGRVHRIEFRSPTGTILATDSMVTDPESVSIALCNTLKRTCVVFRMDWNFVRNLGLDTAFLRLGSRDK
jgi:hypothetical protein